MSDASNLLNQQGNIAERLVPRYVEQGAKAPDHGDSPPTTRYAHWRIDPPDGSLGPAGEHYAYFAGNYEDVCRHVNEHWPSRTRIVYAPEPASKPQMPPESAKPLTAADICVEAARLVGGSRAVTHGDKALNFRNTADMWNALIRAKLRRDGYDDHVINSAASLSATDIGSMLEAFKIARRYSGSFNVDDYIDGAGYAGCAGEIAAQDSNAT